MSRFDDNARFFDTNEKAWVRPIRLNPSIPVEQTFEAVIGAGETLDSIAYRLYGNSRLWWIIADLNDLTHALYIKPGTKLRFLLPRFIEWYVKGI